MFKKFISVILVLVISVCGLAGVMSASALSADSKLTYSNMADKKTQKEVLNALVKAGIPKKDAEAFMQNVKLYNKAIKNKGLTKNGFKTVKGNPSYPDWKQAELWDKAYPDFVGWNCRITAYTLMRHKIAAKSYPKTSSLSLAFDDSAMDNMPGKKFHASDRGEFRALYNSVKAPAVSSRAVQYLTMKRAWDKNSISFSGKTDAKLISVIIHSMPDKNDSELFVGHTGVLIPDGKNGYFFIEKLTFQMPYQVVRFSSKAELSRYLLSSYKDYKDQGGAAPFLMENGCFLA